MPAFLENNGNKGRAWNGGREKCMNDTVTTIILAQALRSTEIPPLHGTVSRVAEDVWFSISIEPKAFTIHIGTYPPVRDDPGASAFRQEKHRKRAMKK